MPGVLAAALLAFALSIDDFVITNFNSGSTITFPLFIWGAARVAIQPQIYVIATMIFLVTVAAMLLTVWQQRRAERMAVGAARRRRAPCAASRRRLERLRADRARARALRGRAPAVARAARARARGSLLAGVPMSWMTMWAGAHPVYLAEAHGATVVDVDGNEYADLCLGDTGAMAGHSPPLPATPCRHHDDAADRGRGLGGRGARAPLRGPVLAVLADRDRRQPLDAADLPPGDRAAARCSSSTGATTARSTRRS